MDASHNRLTQVKSLLLQDGSLKAERFHHLREQVEHDLLSGVCFYWRRTSDGLVRADLKVRRVVLARVLLLLMVLLLLVLLLMLLLLLLILMLYATDAAAAGDTADVAVAAAAAAILPARLLACQPASSCGLFASLPAHLPMHSNCVVYYQRNEVQQEERLKGAARVAAATAADIASVCY